MSQVTLLATDLDGTLLNRANQVSARTQALLRAAQSRGVRIVLATTRNLYFVRELCAALGLTDPIICSNGAQVMSAPQGETWAYRTISTPVAQRIAQLADEQGWAMSSTIGEMKYVRQRPQQALGQIAPNVTVVPTNAAGIVGQPIRLLFWHPAAIAFFRELCHTELGEHCHTETYYSPTGAVESFGIFPAGADKGSALALVLRQLQITVENVLAIGDNNNDIPLFSQAGIKVAMGNGTTALKQLAHVIAPDHEHDGVAWAIEQFVL